MTDNKTFMDKGLEEIIREKGIEKPNYRKRKYKSSPNQKFEKKNPNFQKRHQEFVTEDLRNRIGGKYSVLITGIYLSTIYILIKVCSSAPQSPQTVAGSRNISEQCLQMVPGILYCLFDLYSFGFFAQKSPFFLIYHFLFNLVNSFCKRAV